jgi:hypothetical protein
MGTHVIFGFLLACSSPGAGRHLAAAAEEEAIVGGCGNFPAVDYSDALEHPTASAQMTVTSATRAWGLGVAVSLAEVEGEGLCLAGAHRARIVRESCLAGVRSQVEAPASFQVLFGTNFYGGFTATCEVRCRHG